MCFSFRDAFGKLLLIGIVFVFSGIEQTKAATINVGCGASDLITAINAANDEGGTNPGPDILELTASCTYTLTAVDNPDNGLPVITSIITINGNGATIERDTGISSPRFRILEVAAATGDLTLNSVTIQGGHTGDSCGGDATSGGGLYNNGQLTINDSIIQNNRTGDALCNAGKGGFGGGLYN